MPKILVEGELHPSGLEILKQNQNIDLMQIKGDWDKSFTPILHEIDGLLLRGQKLDSDTISKMTNLKIVSRYGVGYDTVDIEALSERKIPLTIVGNVLSQTVAEHAFLLTIALSKNLLRYDFSLWNGDWNIRNSLKSMDLFGKNVFIIGLGKIGIRYAMLTKAFGMNVKAYDPLISKDYFKKNKIEYCHNLIDGLKNADVISLHIPKPSKPIITKNEINLLKKTSIIINTSRGEAIEENDLINALENEKIRGVALDVFKEEPLSTKSKLITSTKTLLTPHSSSLTIECAERMAITSVQNLVDFFENNLNPDMVVNSKEINYI